jgi:hypothetical protein
MNFMTVSLLVYPAGRRYSAYRSQGC